ncbi:hypothetical protein [Ammoniphilus sp. CFH 90114]|uniref:hypothetical protein n=1 Tax=Ammoniphilus sp. CFH 90114 TaxID=2493665 RepID=UPI0013E95A17|nr:hypothetical protein [Ammoniphilus sp. CFH 90114]
MINREQLIEQLKHKSWDELQHFSRENPGLLILEEEGPDPQPSFLRFLSKTFHW